jgi:SecD/SecF fusion protein
MLIGVIVGVYSSMFVAAPVLVDLGGEKALGSSPDPVTAQRNVPKTKPVIAKQS